jgi:hypothetical protein
MTTTIVTKSWCFYLPKHLGVEDILGSPIFTLLVLHTTLHGRDHFLAQLRIVATSRSYIGIMGPFR